MERDDGREAGPLGPAPQPAPGQTPLPAPERERAQQPEQARTPEAARERESPQWGPERGPDRAEELLKVRGYYIRLTAEESGTLRDIGSFRTVDVADLARFRYRDDGLRLEENLRTLEAQGLVQRRAVSTGPDAEPLQVAVLSKTGKRALEHKASHAIPDISKPSQAFYAGFVKAREVRHDAAIYRMFQADKARLERSGSRIERVVLDYELKRRVYAPLAKARSLPKAEFAKLQLEVARANGLKVIHGKIPLPDLRVEYIDSQGVRGSVDLELATGHYHGGAMATKAQAGFRFYVSDGSASKLSRSLEERDITVAILSL